MVKSGISLKTLDKMKSINKIPSNVFIFDLLTKGGIPEGKFTLFWGNKSAGKTSFALRMIDQYLKLNPNKRACFVDFENALDKKWAEILIDDHDRVDIAEPAYAEEGIDFLQEYITDEDTGLFVIDSLASMIPVAEADSAADKVYMGILARTVSTLLRRILPPIVTRARDDNPATVILINQIRSNISTTQTYGSPYKLPGGLYQEHVASLIVRFYQEKIHKNSKEIPYRIDYNFVVEKNKCGGIPKVAGKFGVACLPYNGHKVGDIIEDNVIADLMKSLKLLTKTKKDTYMVLDEEFKTQTEVMERLKTDFGFRQLVMQKIEESFYGK